MLDQTGALPDLAVACVGGGSNAIGLFHPFLADPTVRLLGIEAGGIGGEIGENAATLLYGRLGVLHGSRSMLLQDEHGQVQETHSISAGLDYPGVGPEHSFLHDIGRVELRVGGRRAGARCARRVQPLRGDPPGARERARARRRSAGRSNQPGP